MDNNIESADWIKSDVASLIDNNGTIPVLLAIRSYLFAKVNGGPMANAHMLAAMLVNDAILALDPEYGEGGG